MLTAGKKVRHYGKGMLVSCTPIRPWNISDGKIKNLIQSPDISERLS
jgi:hypothetical protein